MGHDPFEETSAGAAVKVRAGTILVASPDIADSPAARSVVLVVESTDAGSLGVTLNRPSETAVHNVLPDWHSLAARPKTVFAGGVANTNSAMCLGVLKAGIDASGMDELRTVAGRVTLVDFDADPAALAPLLDGVRVFAGYTSWGMGELDAQIASGAWLPCALHHADVLVPPRVDLWGRILRRQPMPLALLATHPLDVSRN